MDDSDRQPVYAQSTPEKSSLKDISLKAAGYSYLVGDAAFIASGIAEKNPAQIGTGIFWGLGGAAAARYGNPNAEKQLELLCMRLSDHLKQHGVSIPQSQKTEELTKHHGILDHIESFLYSYPSQMLNAVYAIGASQLIHGNMGKLKGHGLTPKLDFATGALVAAGSLAGLLIPEKKPDPNHPPQTMIDKATAWIQEKPLRVSAGFFWGGNAVLLAGAANKMHEAKKHNSGNKGYLWRFLIAACYIFANSMLSLSSKDNANNSTSEKSGHITDAITEKATFVIAAQPPHVQEELIKDIAAHLATDTMVKMPANQIEALLHAKLKAMAPTTPQPNATSEKTWEGKVAQTGLATAPSL